MSDRKQALRDDVVAARGEVMKVVGGLTPEKAGAPTSNEGWSAKDTLAHLASIEGRLRSMWQHGLDGRAWPADDADINVYNDRCVTERRPWPLEKVVAELEQTGRDTLSFLDRLAPNDLDRTFNHPTRGTVTIESLIQIVPRHLRAHAEEIKAAIGG